MTVVIRDLAAELLRTTLAIQCALHVALMYLTRQWRPVGWKVISTESIQTIMAATSRSSGMKKQPTIRSLFTKTHMRYSDGLIASCNISLPNAKTVKPGNSSKVLSQLWVLCLEQWCSSASRWWVMMCWSSLLWFCPWQTLTAVRRIYIGW